MGLLDALSSDDAKLGIALLSASGYSPTPTSFGQRLGGALGQFQSERNASQDHAMKRQLLQSQIDENASQNMLRQGQVERQKRQDDYYLGGGGGGSNAPQAPGGGAPGAVLKSAIGAPDDAPPPGRGKFAEWSQKYNIPIDALVSDYFSNGGKGIAAILVQKGAPDIQVSNGYAYDKNRVQPGFMPFLNTSSTGQTSMGQIGPDGQPVVSAPRGAADAYRTYKTIDAEVAAGNKPIKVFNNATKQDEYVSEADVLGRSRPGQNGTPPPMARPGTAANMGGAFTGSPETIMATINGYPEPVRTQMRQAYVNQTTGNNPAFDSMGTGAQSPYPVEPAGRSSFAAGPSAQDQVSGKFNEKMATEQGDLLTKSYTAANDASSALAGIRESRKAIQGGAYQGTGAEFKLGVAKFGQALGINIDPEKTANTDYLKSTLGNGLLEKAKTLGSNPSNADASRITDIVGSIGKDPNAMTKILDWQEEMLMKAINGHNTRVGQAEQNGFKSQFDLRVPAPEKTGVAPPKVLNDLPKSAPKGQRIRDTTTGKILQWNGLQWKEQ